MAKYKDFYLQKYLNATGRCHYANTNKLQNDKSTIPLYHATSLRKSTMPQAPSHIFHVDPLLSKQILLANINTFLYPLPVSLTPMYIVHVL